MMSFTLYSFANTVLELDAAKCVCECLCLCLLVLERFIYSNDLNRRYIEINGLTRSFQQFYEKSFD